MRPFLPALLAATALAVAACSGSGAGGSGTASSAAPKTTSPASAAGDLTAWTPCPKVAPRLQCASLRVPVNYADPAGRTITLALSRVPATAPASQREGVLLVNPGGPGGAGRSLAAVVATGLRPAVAARYDIIGFDTRGTGASVPAMHCDPSFFAKARPDYIPASAAAEQVLIGRAGPTRPAASRSTAGCCPT